MAARRGFSARVHIAPESVLRAPVGAEHRIGTGLIVAAAWYLTATALMLGAMAATSPAAGLDDELAADPDLLPYRLPFVAASLLAPAMIAMVLLLIAGRGEGVGVRDGLALLFLPAYLACCSVAYVSQYAILPGIVRMSVSQADPWYFPDERSIPYALDLLGYAFLGIAMCLVAVGFLGPRGLPRAIGVVLASVGVTSIVAFATRAFGSDTATAVFTWTSAALTLPLAVLAIVLGMQLRRRRAPVLDAERADFWT